MANELAIVENNWPALVGQAESMPVPFGQTIFLTECHLAGTAEIDDMLVKTQDVVEGTEVVLKRTATGAQDGCAIAVRTAGGKLIGYVPRRHSAVMARLMDAGKNLSARVVGKELDGHWLDVTVSIEMKEV